MKVLTCSDSWRADILVRPITSDKCVAQADKNVRPCILALTVVNCCCPRQSPEAVGEGRLTGTRGSGDRARPWVNARLELDPRPARHTKPEPSLGPTTRRDRIYKDG